MAEKYSYLKPYCQKELLSEGMYVPRNIFHPIQSGEIDEYEKKLGFEFPSQLKEFWREIGYGFLKVPHNRPQNYKFGSTNRINTPGMIGDIILEGVESEMILEDTLESIEPGDIAFFEVFDSNKFLYMKPQSSNPNAVWSLWNIKIEDSFEQFIWRLYYESPSYYDKIIISS